MPLRLDGSCRCGAARFAVSSHAPHPYQRCYCSICRKTAGGGGYAVNLSALNATLDLTAAAPLAVFHAEIDGERSPAGRHACPRCATALWLHDPRWPDLLHPFASAIDTPLPTPPSLVHIMLGSKAPWVVPEVGPDDACFDAYPERSIEDWHRERGLWVE